MNTASILGVQFHAVTKQQAVELAMSKIRSRQKGYVVTPNRRSSISAAMTKNSWALSTMRRLSCRIGIGIIYAAKILGESCTR